MEKSSVYSRIIQVKADHLDALLHVNNVQYLHWMMESAEAHWQLRAPQSVQEEFIWVVRKHEIEYFGQAMEGDELLLKTWTGKATGASWWRHYSMEKLSTKSPIIVAATQFVLVSRVNGKPQPIRSNIISIFKDH